MAVGVPLAITLLFLMVFLLKWLNPFDIEIPKGFKGFVREKQRELGLMGPEQKITIAVFTLAALLWILKDVFHYWTGFEFLNDTSVAILAGVLLFFIPVRWGRSGSVLGASDIAYLPWNIVLLFGGGMAMAASLEKVGVIKTATEFFAEFHLGGAYGIIFLLTTLALVMTEVMSNVALCVVALPMIMKLGEAQGFDPLLFAMPAALASSFAFSMPVSTPPNAIVFGTDLVTVRQMLRSGIWLNVVALVLTMTLGYGLMQVFL